ncbi:MAG: hypothetical protein OSB07_12255 [Dehalococcoidia bacterium]|nr:hypothetical protein [Dehalococcoidia bacterium]
MTVAVGSGVGVGSGVMVDIAVGGTVANGTDVGSGSGVAVTGSAVGSEVSMVAIVLS